MACLTHPVDADGKSHTPAPNTEGVTEMEGLGRANLAKNGKKRRYFFFLFFSFFLTLLKSASIQTVLILYYVILVL